MIEFEWLMFDLVRYWIGLLLLKRCRNNVIYSYGLIGSWSMEAKLEEMNF